MKFANRAEVKEAGAYVGLTFLDVRFDPDAPDANEVIYMDQVAMVEMPLEAARQMYRDLTEFFVEKDGVL